MNLNNFRDFLNIKDIVSAIDTLRKNKAFGIYNIGSGKEYLILDIVKFVANSLNYKGKITCTSNSQSFDGSSWYADIDKLKLIGTSNLTFE